MTWPHFHHFKTIMDHATAYFEKQEGQSGSRCYYDGILQKCKCGKQRLVPFNKRYNAVDVEAVEVAT